MILLDGCSFYSSDKIPARAPISETFKNCPLSIWAGGPVMAFDGALNDLCLQQRWPLKRRGGGSEPVCLLNLLRVFSLSWWVLFRKEGCLEAGWRSYWKRQKRTWKEGFPFRWTEVVEDCECEQWLLSQHT